ncbi:hypothetical protein LEP1GSC193_0502 [Leptospira alstonii serovar Pingchang str. 80-412]|uniref:Uncharacterized protein n=2 Tax=Leptospira alstonii TaxID=28452 RepID=M6CUJ0_9LEPT|nr:hypothetical protein LEP1GSC194_0702 [Leptospira alstonii serovar Sichuan str. 79601]EQA79564.1 hypothetical protein LEP1GSC193_0502 [Leptospira alstonii serovar Pingchang str. 80-412]
MINRSKSEIFSLFQFVDSASIAFAFVIPSSHYLVLTFDIKKDLSILCPQSRILRIFPLGI